MENIGFEEKLPKEEGAKAVHFLICAPI